MLGGKSQERQEAVVVIQMRDGGVADHSSKGDGKCLDLGYTLKLMLQRLADVGEGKCQAKNNHS